MATNVKARLKAGKACINGWLHIPNGFSAEMMAQSGWDSVTVDMQHGVQDYMSMVHCFQAMAAFPVTPLVRVPWNEPGIVGKVLDGGAMGVIAPMINTRHDAEALVAYAKYPPTGTRSNGPIRAGLYGEANAYQETANDEVMVVPMVETAAALENLESILAVKGIDMVYIGPSDLAFSRGLKPYLDREEPDTLAIYDRVVAEAGKRGVIAGIHCGSAPYAARMLAKGFRFVTIGSDATLMVQKAKESLALVRKEASGLV